MSQDSGPKTLLVVDDDRAWSLLIRDELEEAGFQVLAAAHPDEAWELLSEQPVSLVVLDVFFARGDSLDPSGLDLARRIRSRDQFRDLPLVFCTVARDEGYKKQMSELTREDAIIIKPPDFNRLRRVVLSLIGSRR